VAASGTQGMRVTVWNASGSPRTVITETQDAVDALDQLGYHAALRLLPDGTYFTYTSDSRNRPQVIDGGWGADYAAADDFIGKLTDLAIWLPTVTPNEVDLISGRAGNYQYNPNWGVLLDQLWVRK
jgi:hypothetical protein